LDVEVDGAFDASRSNHDGDLRLQISVSFHEREVVAHEEVSRRSVLDEEDGPGLDVADEALECHERLGVSGDGHALDDLVGLVVVAFGVLLALSH
jgi:hypothetical protein